MPESPNRLRCVNVALQVRGTLDVHSRKEPPTRPWNQPPRAACSGRAFSGIRGALTAAGRPGKLSRKSPGGPYRLEAWVVEVNAVRVDCVGYLHQAERRAHLGILAGHGVGAFADVGDHQTQHRVGLGFELAVGDDAADSALHLSGQLAVLRRRELAGVGGT